MSLLQEEEDMLKFKSERTGRGPLSEGWREDTKPIMCSYKLVDVRFELSLLTGRIEEFVHRAVREILLVGHRQAFAWIDEWFGMTIEDVRDYEQRMQAETNEKVRLSGSEPVTPVPEPGEAEAGGSVFGTPATSPDTNACILVSAHMSARTRGAEPRSRGGTEACSGGAPRSDARTRIVNFSRLKKIKSKSITKVFIYTPKKYFCQNVVPFFSSSFFWVSFHVLNAMLRFRFGPKQYNPIVGYPMLFYPMNSA